MEPPETHSHLQSESDAAHHQAFPMRNVPDANGDAVEPVAAENLPNRKFLGMTKFMTIALVIVIIIVSLMIQAFVVYRVLNLVDQGERSHAAVCLYRKSLVQQVHDSKKFLALTVPEREAKYGRALGDIPPSTIKHSQSIQEKIIVALGAAQC